MIKWIPTELPGAESVIEWFGTWPSFHDAEVISISLARSGKSVLRVYPYYPQKTATVKFVFEEITDVELSDFSPQNVIFDLNVEVAKDGNGDPIFRVILHPCFGLAGRIEAKRLEFALEPGQSPDGVSQW